MAGKGTVLFTCAAWLITFASLAVAQNPAPAATATPHPEHARHASAKPSADSHKDPAKDKDAANKENKPPTPELPNDAAATPAEIILKDGQLTVVAKNSDLHGILEQIAETSGMTIDGPGKDTRVFGVYGPGNPRDVLTDLLSDSGCNFMMVGDTADGAPRTLVLTALNGSSASTAPATAAGPPVEAQPAAQPPTPAEVESQDEQLRMQRHLEQMQQMQPQADPQ